MPQERTLFSDLNGFQFYTITQKLGQICGIKQVGNIFEPTRNVFFFIFIYLFGGEKETNAKRRYFILGKTINFISKFYISY